MNDKLKQKLKLFKDQRLGNGIMVIIAVLILIFVPLATFENLRFELSLEWIIAFVVLIVGIVRAVILNSKIEELEFDLGHNLNKEIEFIESNIPDKKLEFICKYCNVNFSSEQLLTKHYLNCFKKKKIEENETLYSYIWLIYGCLVVLFFIMGIIFLNKGMVSIFKIFIPVSVIFFIGFVLYMQFYLEEKIIAWLKKKVL
jgi:hypothetical protein